MVNIPTDQHQAGQVKIPHWSALLLGLGGRADALVLWSKAAFVSLHIPKSKNFSIALILPQFQRGRPWCRTEVWESGGTHCPRINMLLCCCFFFVWGVERVLFSALCFSFKGVDEDARMWLWTFQKNLVLPWPCVHKSIWFPIIMKRETSWIQVRS